MPKLELEYVVSEKLALTCMGSIPDADELTNEQAKDYMDTLKQRLKDSDVDLSGIGRAALIRMDYPPSIQAIIRKAYAHRD